MFLWKFFSFGAFVSKNEISITVTMKHTTGANTQLSQEIYYIDILD